MSKKNKKTEIRFLTDRMLGTLTRYLRFLGYDTLSATTLQSGNKSEDTILLGIASATGRMLLTRDRELAVRGGNLARHFSSDDVLFQVRQLIEEGLISDDVEVRMQRCPLCNSILRLATREEIKNTEYAPQNRMEVSFYWCPQCRRLYWMGSHGRNLTKRLRDYLLK